MDGLLIADMLDQTAMVLLRCAGLTDDQAREVMATLWSSRLDRITTNPAVMAGAPVVRGTRIPAETITAAVRGSLLADYPQLDQADIAAALLWSAAIGMGQERER